MSISTKFTKLFGIKHPIIQAPMALVAGGKLAAAVQKAGGLGMVAGGYSNKLFLERELQITEGTNPGIGLITWTIAENPGIMDFLLERRPPAIYLSFGDISPYIARIKAKGIKVITQVQTVKQAKDAVDMGADVLVAQGSEAGGHGGKRGTFSLVPGCVDVAKGIPVLAAGGIADGRGLAASLMLGAEGVVMGTRFYATKEALPPHRYKQGIVEASGDDTVKTGLMDLIRGLNWNDSYHCRFIKNEYLEKLEKGEIDLKRNLEEEKRKMADGMSKWEIKKFPIVAGEGIDLIHDILSAKEVVEKVITEAVELLKTKKEILSI